jgi:hypothetical protein
MLGQRLGHHTRCAFMLGSRVNGRRVSRAAFGEAGSMTSHVDDVHEQDLKRDLARLG